MNNFVDLKKRAEQGIPAAQNDLGFMYYVGEEVEQNFKEAAKWFTMAAQNGYADAQYHLGLMNYAGEGVEQNFEEAAKWFTMAAQNGDVEVQSLLGFMHVWGRGVEQNYEKAKKYFQKSYENEYTRDEYYIEIFKNLNNKEIKEIQSIAEIIGNDLGKNIGAVLIKPKTNLYAFSHTLYDLEIINRIKKEVQKTFLSGVEVLKEDKSNEFKVFKQIVIKIANLVLYDHIAVLIESVTFTEKIYTSGNLIGAVLEEKCVCSGYSELLRNLCACRGIECLYITSHNHGPYSHAFCQVKIQGNWYYFDLTNACEKIKKGEPIESFLLSKKEFQDSENKSFIPLPNQTVYESPVSYSDRIKAENMRGVCKNAVNGKNLATAESVEKAITCMQNQPNKKTAVQNKE